MPHLDKQHTELAAGTGRCLAGGQSDSGMKASGRIQIKLSVLLGSRGLLCFKLEKEEPGSTKPSWGVLGGVSCGCYIHVIAVSTEDPGLKQIFLLLALREADGKKENTPVLQAALGAQSFYTHQHVFFRQTSQSGSSWWLQNVRKAMVRPVL